MTELGFKLRFEPRPTYFWNRSSCLLYYNPVGLSTIVIFKGHNSQRGTLCGGQGADCWCLEGMLRTWFSPGAIGRGKASSYPELGARTAAVPGHAGRTG